MANEIQELKFQVGEAWKGVYSPSTAYGLANVVQDPTGLSIYRSLKSGNVGHPLSNASWWFRIIDLSSIKAESDRIAALNQSIAQDEALRVAAEELRQQHEAERVAAETQRNEAEQQRISAEQARVNAESARATAEQQRITAEQGRVSAESARVQAEQARVLAETLRANAEDQRAANEQNRVAAEQQRIERAEQDHQRAESDHATYVDSLGAFDISSYHATDGVLAKYADLTAALGTGGANIPDDLRKGGMSVKFVQSSDNKYVSYRLTKDEWSIDTEDWAIADEGVYVENPEFIYVKTDANNKILWAIKTDGSIYYGAGVPPQVVEYINEKIAELSLDEYEDIVAFLDGLEDGENTLTQLLEQKANVTDVESALGNKVDKEEGKSLIDSEFAASQSVIENPEYIEVTTDSEDKVIEGIQQDGTKVIGGDLKVLGNMDVSGVSYKVIENPEYLAAWVDAEDKVIFGIKTDGKTYVGDADFLNDIKDIKAFLDTVNKKIDWDALPSITAVENPEFIEAKTDSEGKLLAGRTSDGVAFENVGFATPKMSIDGHNILNIEDPEQRCEVSTDKDGKVLSYRERNGVKVETVGIKAKKIVYSEENITDIINALKEHNYGKGYDLRLPQLRVTSSMLAVDGNDICGLFTSKNKVDCDYFFISNDYCFIESGNIAYQGNSTLSDVKKGFSIKFKNKHRFGNWVEFKSFQTKAYYSRVLHTRDIACCRLIERVYQHRPVTEKRPYNTYNDFGEKNIYNLIDGGALCHVDGFPCELYINDSYWGVYYFNIKKDEANYLINKKNLHHIQIEAGNDSYYTNEAMADGGAGWANIEIRDPEAYEMEGVEPPAGPVKTAWQDFIRRLNAVTANTTVSELFDFLNVREWVDTILICNIIHNYDFWCKNTLYTTWDCVVDGNNVTAHWSPLLYDMDSTLNDATATDNPFRFKAYEHCPWLSIIETVLDSKLKERYADLRSSGTITPDTIREIMEAQVLEIGFDAYKDEIKRWGYNSETINESIGDIDAKFRSKIAYLDAKYQYSAN